MMYNISGPVVDATVKSCTPSVPAWVELSRAMIVMSSSPLVPRIRAGPPPEDGHALDVIPTDALGGAEQIQAAFIRFRAGLHGEWPCRVAAQ